MFFVNNIFPSYGLTILRSYGLIIMSLFCSYTFTYGQAPPQVKIIQPLNEALFEGVQVKVDFEISGTTPNFVRVLVDDSPKQLVTNVKIGDNTVMVDVPSRNCKISIVARNEFGESLPASVHLTWNGREFKPTLYILAIGISDYNDPNLQLLFAAKDAIDFSESMLQQKGLLYEDVVFKILTDRQASAENIRDGLYWLQTAVTQHDVAMLYMAGHGINNTANNFFFMPFNADANRINATCVGWSEITETINVIAGKRVLFMDACFSGNVLGSTRQRSTLNQAILSLTGADNGAVVFTSSTSRQVSLENSEWNNGAFTKALVEGLNGKADPYGSKIITVKSLDLYITMRVKELTKGQQAPTTIVPASIPDFPLAVVTEPPSLTTNTVTTFSYTTATLGGNIVKTGTPPYTERGIIYSTTQNPTIENNKTVISGLGTGNFSINITGLTDNTTYYVSAYATNTEGTAYGEQIQFTTPEIRILPALVTNPVTNITETTATFGGNITNVGIPPYTERGLVYSTTQNPTTDKEIRPLVDKTVILGSGAGNFTVNITNLTANTTYYVRSYATNIDGTAYGMQEIFTTLAPPPPPPPPTPVEIVVPVPKDETPVGAGLAPAQNENAETTVGATLAVAHDSNVIPALEKKEKTTNYLPFYLSVSSGASGFGKYSLGETNKGGASLYGAELAYFFKPNIGAGLKMNVATSDAIFNFQGSSLTYRDRVMFVGPALYARKENKEFACTLGAGLGVINWKLSDVTDIYYGGGDDEVYSSVGGFLSVGISYMFTRNVGLGLNIQTLLGSLEDQYGFIRKPTGIGGTVGVNFRF